MTNTMFDKIWSAHTVSMRSDGMCLLYIDRHIVHDATAQAFAMIEAEGLSVRRPDLTLGTADHYVPTDGRGPFKHADLARMVGALENNAARHGFTSYGYGHSRQGIVHVVGPELGFTLPGSTLVCADSHTSTHGALGTLAFGIGQSEVAHVLATQTLWQRKPKKMRLEIGGRLAPGTFPKDLILAIIAKIGAGGGTGYVIEYTGPAIHALSMAGRMTVCNMAIECGARAAMVAPDDVTFQWLSGQPFAPRAERWDAAVAYWRTLPSHPEAVFDRKVEIDASGIEPQVTWGTSPQDSLPISSNVPDPERVANPDQRGAMRRSLEYMQLVPGQPLTSITVDRVFIGSCTNGRLEDLREAAIVARGRMAKIPAHVVPGSAAVKAAAEAEGLDRIFRNAGFRWNDPGCSMCVAMNGDIVPLGERCASTSNRNFVGRQGPGARTHLMSPAMAAAAAVTGLLSDVRTL